MAAPRVTCLICGEGAEAGAFVACAVCASVHHQDCFEFAGRCAVYGCGGRGVREVAPSAGAVLVLGAPRLMPGAVAERRLELGRGQVDFAPRVVSLEADRVQFDRSGDLGALIKALQIFGVSLGLFLLYPLIIVIGLGEQALGVHPGVLLGTWFLGFVVLATLHKLYEKAYVLDMRGRRLLERSVTLGLPRERDRCGFEDVAAVAVQGKPGRRSAWAYGLVLVLKSGRVLPLTDATSEDLEAQNENARLLAQKLDVPDLPGEARAELVVTKPLGKPPILEQRRR